jgi:hypothetical protein
MTNRQWQMANHHTVHASLFTFHGITHHAALRESPIANSRWQISRRWSQIVNRKSYEGSSSR